jgi:2-polyprenyl-6-methoxyphenol hydroxylase-like FAD-dependent oxidoreductase
MACRAIVIGGGIAGLAAAIALRKADYAVTVLEQASELLPMGAALSLWGNAMAALGWLGAGERIAAQAAPIRVLEACDQRGRPILHTDIARAYAPGQPVPCLSTRSLLQSCLLAAASGVDVWLGVRIAEVDQSGTSASVRYANGMVETADLAIVADGIGSETATRLIGTRACHAGYGGVLALSGEAPGARAEGEASEYWGRGERFGLLDLGQDRSYWFFMRNEASPAESAVLTLLDIERRIDEWPAELGIAVRATSPDCLIPFSIHAKPPPRRLGQGRIICVGDAAHAMEPNLGQGGCQALEDAMALGIAAQCCPPEAILPLFETMRLRRIRQFVDLSRSATFIAQSRNHALVGAARILARTVPDRLSEWRVSRLHRLPTYAAMAAR